MTVPAYSVRRSELARNIGLGQKRRTYVKAAEKVVQADEAAPEKAKKGRGRPLKATEAEAA